MENKRYILLLLVSSSFLSYSANAVCVPRYVNSSTPSPTPSPFPRIIESPSESPKQKPALVSLPKTSLPPSPSNQHSGSFKHSAAPAFPSHNQNFVLNKICSATEHPEACIASVSPFVTSELSIDALSVLQIEIKALLNGFEKAIATAKIMMNNPSRSAWVKSCLETCIDVYDSGVGDLNNVAEAIASRDIYRLQTLLSSTISYVESCEDSFTEQPGVESPMKKVDEELNMLASNNLAIATLLNWT